MRHAARALCLLACVVLAACGTKAQPNATREPSPPAEPVARESREIADLRTRKTGSDWPCFLGPTHDSKSTERGLLTHWPAAGPRQVWQTSLGTGYGMPTISLGRLFQFDCVARRARLRCLRSETGDPLWTFEYPSHYEDLYQYDDGPRTSPVVDDDRVYVLGVEGMLYCLDAADGRERWKIDTIKEFGVVQNFFGVGSTPIIEGDLLIAQIGGSPPESREVPPGQLDRVVGNGLGVVAFDKYTGQIKYRLGDELASYSSPVTATIAGRRWCFVFARGGLLGFEPEHGTLDFHYPWRAPILESVNAANPVVVDDLVFISETYGLGSSLLKVRPGHFDVVWSDAATRREKAMQTHWNTAIHHEGFLYGSSGRHTNNAELRSIELKTGAVRWSQPGLSRSSLLYVDGHFVCLTEFGELILLRATPEKYDAVASVALPGAVGDDDSRLLAYPAWAAPILSQGLLYVRGKGRLVCLELIPPAGEPASAN